ncbi:hypothetical protein GMORB2_5099 [Geosmithia morbida]|uniref:Amino acid permease/ SLC12A domain-containing protein n=1 Tax=Geosmithia morbida TaxID=1094350 RepID=A0A9P4YWK8_9HYPO|nr:uncharacterized protein GMORB2_5099 [Geosmithia morbida]KAF4124433.1 hypothetical protein GMORB2_5099 [Geosmithia morbida]
MTAEKDFDASSTGLQKGEDGKLDVELARANSNVEFNLATQSEQLERGLKSRHIQFLALASGPAALFMGYISMMIVVWCIMNALSEIVTYLPMRGITVPYFVDRFVDPSLGFAAGWNYWYAYAMLMASEAVAASIIIDYWEPPVDIAVWIAIVLVVMLLLNILAVSVFGEAEFWFASIKFITIIGLIILGWVIFFGGAPNQSKVRGFSYYNDPGAFNPYQTSGGAGRFLAYWHALAAAGFAFVTSPELIATAAGETVAPRRNIPKAARRFTLRLAIFYGFSSLLVGILVPYDHPDLVGSSANAAASPFVIGIREAGIPVLNHVINGAILTSAWSAGNSFLYSGSRILYSLALKGQAPAVFRRVNRKGVPWLAVLATWSIGFLAFLNVSNSGAKVFTWFMNISTISGYIAWIVVLITYIRFRKAMAIQNLLGQMPLRTPLQPYMSYVVLFLVSLITITNGFQIFIPRNWNVSDFFAAYVTIPIFLVLYAGHKIWFRTPLRIPIEQVDVITGKKEMDDLAALDEPPIARNWVEKVWLWLT